MGTRNATDGPRLIQRVQLSSQRLNSGMQGLALRLLRAGRERASRRARAARQRLWARTQAGGAAAGLLARLAPQKPTACSARSRGGTSTSGEDEPWPIARQERRLE